MATSTRKWIITACLTVVGAVALSASSFAAVCLVSDGTCSGTITVQERTHPPYVPCPAGDFNVEVVLDVKCPSQANHTFLKCSSRSDPIDWTDSHGINHKIALINGATWEDVYNGDCADMVYKNDS